MIYKRLRKSDERLLGGVCGGLAEWLVIDPTVVRIIYAGLTVFSAGFPGVILYIILCFVMPKK